MSFRFAHALVVATLVTPGCGTDETPPPVPAPPHDLKLSVNDLVGCYEVVSIVWIPEILEPPGYRRTYTPPRFFALAADAVLAGKYRRSKPRDPNEDHRFTYWELLDDYQLGASWTNGYAGIRAVVRQRSTDRYFYGRAVPISDGGGAPPSRGTIVFRPVTCWAN